MAMLSYKENSERMQKQERINEILITVVNASLAIFH